MLTGQGHYRVTMYINRRTYGGRETFIPIESLTLGETLKDRSIARGRETERNREIERQ